MNIVLGTEQLGGVDWGNYKISDVEKGVRRALELGIKRYDTAHIYGLGNSEVRLGKILGSKRYEVEITTKIGLYSTGKKISGRYKIKKDLSFDKMLYQTEKSLKNMNLECVPILLAHWPDELNSTEQVMENLIKIRDKGLAKKIGLSNF
jgi:aryl-alcohol dehydrogenase-like predicted oxidoreductase